MTEASYFLFSISPSFVNRQIRQNLQGFIFIRRYQSILAIYGPWVTP